jgi:hypothetical protein
MRVGGKGADGVIKATIELNGRTTLMIGLSFGNLNKFYKEPGDTFIKIDGKQMDLPIDILLFSGETEMHLAQLMERNIGPDTIVHIDTKLKS